MNRRRLTAILGTVIAAAGITVGCVAATASTSVGPYSLVSAANNGVGLDEASGTYAADATFTPISPSGSSGYVELVASDGSCLTYVSTSPGPASAACTGSAAQLWDVIAHGSAVVMFNKAFDGANTKCAWNGGHTQAVLSLAATGAPGLAERCDDAASGTAWPYGTDQEWIEQPPVAPSPSGSPSVSPSPSPSPSPTPTAQCSQPPVTEPAPADVPAFDQVGGLITSMTGAQLVQNYDTTQTMFDGSHTNADPPSVDANGNAVLSTNGNTNDQAMLSSCFFNGTGSVYTHGVFEVRMNLPAASGSQPGNIANWPAFWLSGYNCGAGTPQPNGSATTLGCWPNGGEFDVYESGPFSGGYQRVDYHYGATASGDAASANDTALTAGWHTVDAVWGPGYVAVYIDGSMEWSYASSNVESNYPLQVILDNAGGGQGVSSTVLVQYLKVWEWA